MNPDELRALADALEPMARAPRFEDFDVPAFCAWVRAQADAQPTPAVPQDEPRVVASFYTEDAELVGTTHAPIKRVEVEDDGTLHVFIDHWPQAEPKRDQPLLDLLAVIHCDGGHHTEAVGIEQSIKDALSAVYVLKGKLAQAEPKREHWNKYFAARAMQPILLAAIQVAGSESRVDFAAAAKSAYRMADEMVKRGRQHV